MHQKLLFLGVYVCIILMQTPLMAQNNLTVSGTVTEAASGDPLIGANVVVKDKVIGTVTDLQGNFSLNINETPITLVVSSVGYRTQEIVVNESTQLDIEMEEQTLLGQEVVVSASRVEESILESPVSIEKMDIRDIRSSPAPNFYDQIANLKGVDVSTQSLTFKSINIRGFGASGNVRTVQLIDGIDNQAPGLNFPVGNIVGISQLDLESVEILPGAASALYGPNAINGIILMNSKSPFEYQGISASVQLGVNHVDGEDNDPALYQNYGLRMAHAFNNKFAIKFTGEYLKAADFIGVDYRDRTDIVERSAEIDPSDRASLRTYDGVNVYGDPVINLGEVAQDPANAETLGRIQGLIPFGESGNFTPTGYTERDFLDNTTESLKLGGALHYRISDDLEALAQYNVGTGSSVYTANDRYVLDNFVLQTAKLELRNRNFFLRAYTTRENSGDTYAANTLATLINLETTVPVYVETFAGARTQGFSVEEAHALARIESDALREENLNNGRFQELFDSLRAIPIPQGAKFVDRTSMWHYEGLYNFSEIIDFADVIIGANYRRYNLDTEGTLFALQENGEEFDINEWGTYLQVSKDLFDDKLDLTGSIRYDKNEYFTGQFSPRLSGVFTFLETQNVRASFQRGFRIPTTQNQFIDLDVVTRRLVGSNPILVDRFNFESNQVYSLASVATAQQNFSTTGDLAASEALLDPVTFRDFTTEKVNTYEVGYKGLINNKLLIDAYYYYSVYTDFIGTIDFIQGAENDPNGDGLPPFEGPANREGIVRANIPLQRYGFVINEEGNINVQGFAVGVDYALAKGYTLGGNVAYNELLDQEALLARGVQAAFNTPKWRYNLKLANQKITDKFGFSLMWRWQDAFLWESALGDGIIPAYQTLDAQVSYKLPELKSILKIGGSNILNERYITSFANPRIGAIYYVSLTFDQFLN